MAVGEAVEEGEETVFAAGDEGDDVQPISLRWTRRSSGAGHYRQSVVDRPGYLCDPLIFLMNFRKVLWTTRWGRIQSSCHCGADNTKTLGCVAVDDIVAPVQIANPSDYRGLLEVWRESMGRDTSTLIERQ